MRPTRLFTTLAVLLFILALTAVPAPAAATRAGLPGEGSITGNGQVCNSRAECGTFQIIFDPQGGPVTGSVNVTWPLTDTSTGQQIGQEVLTGTLTGTFVGGDGGTVSGTMDSGTVTVTYTVQCPTCTNASQSVVGTPWEGTLRADGSGDGWIGPPDILWSVTYSAEDFTSGHGSRTSTPPAPAGTITPGPTVAGGINAAGQFCSDEMGFCGPIQFSFNPAGGPVSGSFSGTYDPGDGTNLRIAGNLTGTFTGGDGGALNGIMTGTWDWSCSTCVVPFATPASLAGMTWGGNLFANGTGSGLLLDGFPWNVTFSADEFQAGLGGGLNAGIGPTATTSEYIQELIQGISVEMGDKPWSEHELQLLREVIQELPPGMVNRLALNSIVRYSTDYDRKGNPDTGVYGDYSPADQSSCPTCARSPQTIRIYDHASTPSDFANDTGDIEFKATILHEMTHALQYYQNDQGIYQNPLVQNSVVTDYIQATTNNNWTHNSNGWFWTPDPANPGSEPPTNYGHTNPLEDMSESVMLYVYDPQRLQTSSPQRYTYIRDQIFGGVEYENGTQKGK